jgi:purine-binding chemotaxis protein CheW
MPNEGTRQRPLVVFRLDEQRYALDLGRVRRAIRVVAITPLPGAPAIVLGIVNLAGEVIPVVDLRTRFERPPKSISLSDQLVVATTQKRTVALLVDETTGVLVDGSTASAPGGPVIPSGLELVDGVVRLKDGLVLIHDLDRLLSHDEETVIDAALDRFDDVGRDPSCPVPCVERMGV